MGEDAREGTRSRFNRLDLHDSRLLGLHLVQRDGARADDLHLNLALLGGRYPDYTWQDAELTFLECTRVVLEIDVTTNGLCGGAITSSRCERDDVLRTDLKEKGMAARDEVLEPYAEFVVNLCPPSGTLRITARDFWLEPKSVKSHT